MSDAGRVCKDCGADLSPKLMEDEHGKQRVAFPHHGEADCLRRQLAARERELERMRTADGWRVADLCAEAAKQAVSERDTARREADNHRAAWRKENTRAERLREERDTARQEAERAWKAADEAWRAAGVAREREGALRSALRAIKKAAYPSDEQHLAALILIRHLVERVEYDAPSQPPDLPSESPTGPRYRWSVYREGDGWSAECQDLPGCTTSGRDALDLFEQMADAERCWMEAARQMGQEVPEPGGGAPPTGVDLSLQQGQPGKVDTPDQGRVVEALALARSMILGREPMTPKAQQVIDEALASLQKGGAR